MGWFKKAFGFSSQPAINSISKAFGQINDLQIGPNNPLSKIAEAAGSDTAARVFSAPSWQEWSKPGEVVYNEFNDGTYVLPEETRQYAAPVAGTILSVVNPFVGAAFNTAYNAGSMQANQKGMDWGAVGSDALRNFGTAAVSSAAKGLTAAKGAGSSAQGSSALSSSVPSNAYWNAVQTAPMTVKGAIPASNALSAFNSAASNFSGASPSSALAASKPSDAYMDTASTADLSYKGTVPGSNALGAFNAAGAASNGVNPYAVPQASGSGSSLPTAADRIKAAAATTGGNMLVNSVADTLAPKQSTALSGFDTSGDIAGPAAEPTTAADPFAAFYQGGDVYNQETYDQGLQGISNNALAQLQMSRDTFLPTGQTEVKPNSPYSSQVDDIYGSTEKAVADYTKTFNEKAKAQQDQKYQSDLEAYQKYQSDLEAYNAQQAQIAKQNAAYQKYQSDLEAFNTQRDAAYQKYQSDLEAYNAQQAQIAKQNETAALATYKQLFALNPSLTQQQMDALMQDSSSLSPELQAIFKQFNTHSAAIKAMTAAEAQAKAQAAAEEQARAQAAEQARIEQQAALKAKAAADKAAKYAAAHAKK